jgi:hypothetical protein
MAIFYVAHEFGGKLENIEKAKKITHDLQVKDLENTYICPLLAFSHLQYGEIGYDAEMTLCFDLLQMCEKIIVASDISKGVDAEISLAEKLLNSNGEPMEVEYLEDTE